VVDDLEQALNGVTSIKTFFNDYLDVLEKNRRKFDKPVPEELQLGSMQAPRQRRFLEEDDIDDEEQDVYHHNENLNLA
jgi:hypothetical protein